MSKLHIDKNGQFVTTLTSDEYADWERMTKWFEINKDDPDVREIVRLSRDIETNFHEMAENAKRVKRHATIAKTMWAFWRPSQAWDKNLPAADRKEFLECDERVLTVLEESDG